VTVAEITTLLSAVAAFVTSMAGVFISLRNATKIDDNTAKGAATDKKVETAIAKVDVVHDAQAQAHEILNTVVATVADVKTNVAKVEVNSNHIREQLVAATASSNLLQGRNEGVAMEKERAATSGEFRTLIDEKLKQ
jgi:hypothetical protein